MAKEASSKSMEMSKVAAARAQGMAKEASSKSMEMSKLAAARAKELSSEADLNTVIKNDSNTKASKEKANDNLSGNKKAQWICTFKNT